MVLCQLVNRLASPLASPLPIRLVSPLESRRDNHLLNLRVSRRHFLLLFRQDNLL